MQAIYSYFTRPRGYRPPDRIIDGDMTGAECSLTKPGTVQVERPHSTLLGVTGRSSRYFFICRSLTFFDGLHVDGLLTCKNLQSLSKPIISCCSLYFNTLYLQQKFNSCDLYTIITNLAEPTLTNPHQEDESLFHLLKKSLQLMRQFLSFRLISLEY